MRAQMQRGKNMTTHRSHKQRDKHKQTGVTAKESIFSEIGK